MADSLNSISIKLTSYDGQSQDFSWNFPEAQIVIRDELILQLMEKVNYNHLKACNIRLGVVNAAVIVDNYTLTDTIYISSFYDFPSYISLFKAQKTNVHVVDQHIKKMQLECQKILLADCEITELDIGLGEQMTLLRKISEGTDESELAPLHVDTIDLRECKINTTSLYAECRYITVRGGKINSMKIQGYGVAKIPSVMHEVKIWNYSVIETLEFCCQSDDLKIKDSTVSNFIAKAHCKIRSISLKDSEIYNAYNFSQSSFDTMCYDAWFLVSKAAEQAKNLSLRAEAYYQMANENAKSEKGFGNILISKIFGICAGYGYKPARIFYSAAIVIFISMLIYTMIDTVKKTCGIRIVHNLLLALAAFAGQSGATMTDGATFWVAIIEYIIGIIFFAMFVNALYVRYRD